MCELIVLMINGFSVKGAKRYIYNDTIVLTVVGIVLGVVLGCVMGACAEGGCDALEPLLHGIAQHTINVVDG